MKIVFLSRIWPQAIERLARTHDCVEALDLPARGMLQVVRDAEVLVVRSPVVLDRAVLQAAAALRLIVRAGTGLDTIDTDYARSRGIAVLRVPLSARSVAEHTIGLLIALQRRIPQLDRSLRAGRWEKHARLGRDLHGAHLGLLGFGRIGRRTAELGRALGMRVSVCDRSPGKRRKQDVARRLELPFLELDALLPVVDVLSIQVPLNAQTRGLIDARRLGLLSADAVLVNVGRGAVIDEEALYDALVQGRLAGAALDVFTKEPPSGSPLLALDNVVATPHVGAQTVQAQQKIGERLVQAIEAFAASHRAAAPEERP